MIVRTLDELDKIGRIRYPADQSFRSARFLIADDGMGFSYNENHVRAGTDLMVWLKNHWEANYIISGSGPVTDLTDEQSWQLRPGVLYVVGPNDRHRLHITEDECHLSIFFPPLRGDERFDEDGSYEASGLIPKTSRRMFIKHLDDICGRFNEHMSVGSQTKTLPLLSKSDGVGFGLSHTSVAAGADAVLKHDTQWQANHILCGSGKLTDHKGSRSWQLGPSTAYYVEPQDLHRLKAQTDMLVLSVYLL